MSARTRTTRHDGRRADGPARRGWAGRGRAALLVWGCLLLAGGAASAGDPEMARFLLKGAKADLAKKQADPAFTKLQRAEQEDPALLEATYLMGVALELREDPKQAVAAYRRFLAGVATKARSGGVPKDEAALVKKAQDRVEALAVSELELRKLDDAFVERLMSFARANVTRDVLTVSQALGIVLELRPGHAEAQKLLTRLGGVRLVSPSAGSKPGAEPPGTSPTPKAADPASAPPFDIGAVKVWKDLLTPTILKANDDWEYRSDGTLALQHRGAHIRNTIEPLITLPSYALEMECRVTTPFAARHGLGFAFAFEKDLVRRLYALFVEGDRVVLLWGDGEESAEVVRTALPPPGPDGWHRIGVVVRGRRVEVFAGGKKVSEHTEARRESLAGEPAIFVQDCKGEIRALRLGTLP